MKTRALEFLLDNFNKYDLYSKEDNCYISYEIKYFYDNLLDKYFIGDLYL